MAKRYCGALRLDIAYVDASDSYTVRIGSHEHASPKVSFPTLEEVRLSPFVAARTARDNPRAFDAIAKAAISFAANDDEAVYVYAETDEDTGDAVISRKG